MPQDYNLPNDYTFVENSWGNSFYKTYDKMNYLDAKSQCESDGAFLATPRSEEENAFIFSLLSGESMWIGVNDIDENGKFVAVNGDLTFTKWNAGEPNGRCCPNGVHIINERVVPNGFWNDDRLGALKGFVCSFDIPVSL